jgi:hypothetical protein
LHLTHDQSRSQQSFKSTWRALLALDSCTVKITTVLQKQLKCFTCTWLMNSQDHNSASKALDVLYLHLTHAQSRTQQCFISTWRALLALDSCTVKSTTVLQKHLTHTLCSHFHLAFKRAFKIFSGALKAKWIKVGFISICFSFCEAWILKIYYQKEHQNALQNDNQTVLVKHAMRTWDCQCL